jgi:transcriptional regulator with XRE-family HTH domain
MRPGPKDHEARQILSEVLRQIRIDAGLTQSDLAARIGRQQSYVSKYESAERRLDLVELELICEALAISTEKVLRRLKTLRGDAGNAS